MSSKNQLILLTGVSSFIGSHVTTQLLEAGYRVRGTIREGKLQAFKEAFQKKYPGSHNLELIVVNDIVKDDFSAALKDVSAIVHVASPLAGKASAEDTLNGALEGTLNVLRQATAANITKVVITASRGTTEDPHRSTAWEGKIATQTSWGQVTREEAVANKDNIMFVYLASKILAEKAAWDYAQAHPELDLATINPPFVYGPWPAGLPTPPGTMTALGTDGFIYNLIQGEAGRPLPYQQAPLYADVRDVARAHVAALNVPPQAGLYKKRYLMSGGAILWYDAVKHLSEVRPALRNRLPALPEKLELPGEISTLDDSPARRELGITEYIPWQKTLEDTVDWLLEAERSW